MVKVHLLCFFLLLDFVVVLKYYYSKSLDLKGLAGRACDIIEMKFHGFNLGGRYKCFGSKGKVGKFG